MRYLLLILAIVFIGCGTTSWVSDPSNENNVKIEKVIRKFLEKPEGELTKADLEKVTKLDLKQNQLTDVKGLEKLTQLEELVLSFNQLTEGPKGLDKLTKLERLGLDGNHLTEGPKGLEKLDQLMGINLSGNQITDVNSLTTYTQFKGLNLEYNQLTSVKGLEKLTKLEVLNLKNNPDLTKAQIDQLQKALPNCKIYSNPTK